MSCSANMLKTSGVAEKSARESMIRWKSSYDRDTICIVSVSKDTADVKKGTRASRHLLFTCTFKKQKSLSSSPAT